MLNQQVLEGRWNEVSGKLRKKWGQLTDDELQSAHGNVDQLIGVIQRKTGEGRDQIEKFLDQAVAGGASAVGQMGETAREFAHNASETVSEASRRAGEMAREGYEHAEEMIRSRPAESMAMCFGAGVLCGVVLALTLRSR